MTIEVPLQRGLVALVDDADAARVREYEWVAYTNGQGNVYVRRRGWSATGPRVYLHRFLLAPPPGVPVDHINGDGLDNRRCNLRIATAAGNAANQVKRPGCSSRMKGVYWYPRLGKWFAQCGGDARSKYLGVFASEEEAGRAYDRAARERWGEFARLNFPNEGAPA